MILNSESERGQTGREFFTYENHDILMSALLYPTGVGSLSKKLETSP